MDVFIHRPGDWKSRRSLKHFFPSTREKACCRVLRALARRQMFGLAKGDEAGAASVRFCHASCFLALLPARSVS